MSTAEQPDALARRIEQLAAAADDEPPRLGLAPVVEVLRQEMAALRTELAGRLDAVAADVAAAVSPAAAQSAPAQDVRALEDAVVARLSPVLAARDDELRRSVLDAVAGVQQSADRDREAVEAGDSTQALAAATDLRERVLDALTELGEVASRSVTASEGARSGVQQLTSGSEDVRGALVELRDGLAATTAMLRSSGQEQSETLARSLIGIEQQVRAELADVRARLDERAEQLAATLARGLTEIADEIDVAATTTRDASERVTVLAELTEVQRAEVERLVHGVHEDVRETSHALRDELLDRTSQQLAALGQRLDRLEDALGATAAGVGERLGVVDTTVTRVGLSVERLLAGMEEVRGATDHLGGTVEAFRSEWPTRTYEVVQGARAVAEAVVLDVRAEVGARLDDVRAALDGVVGTVADARSGLDDGTARLAQAGRVLVAYLEQRDRLLEAERDRVLHDVLDAFAAGLPGRERSALADRLNDAVARRRDARDAERYREAVGTPVAPTADLPDEVRRLALPGVAVQPDQGAPGPPDGGAAPGSASPGDASPGSAGPGSAGPAPDPAADPVAAPAADPAAAPAAVPAAPAAAPAATPPAAPSRAPAVQVPAPPAAAGRSGLPRPVVPAGEVRLEVPLAGFEERPSAPRPSVRRPGPGGGAVVPGPGRLSASPGSGPAAAPGSARGDSEQRTGARGVTSPRAPRAGGTALVRPAPGAAAPRRPAARSSGTTAAGGEGGGGPGTTRGASGPGEPQPGGQALGQGSARQGSGRSVPARTPSRSGGRGRLDVMPEVPDVDVALDAAAPRDS